MMLLEYTLAPVVAVLFGSLAAMVRRPSAAAVSALQHLAAGVVFGAAASEILPRVVHEASPVATLSGGAIGVAIMLALKQLETRFTSRLALLAASALDILIDGLVLGLAFIAGAKAGLLLTIALTLEVLFLGLSLATELAEEMRSKARVVTLTVGISLLLPVGALAAFPVAAMPSTVIAGVLSFGLMALLYLVTEELLVEAHTKADTPFISSMFFVGFLALLLIEETL